MNSRSKFVRLALISCVLKIMCLGYAGAETRDVDLSAEIQMDILLTKAAQQRDAEKWSEAAQIMGQVAKLGLAVSNDFHFSYGEVLLKAGDKEQGVRELTAYVIRGGPEAPKFGEAVSNLWQNVRATELSTNLIGGLRLRVVEDFVKRGVQTERWADASRDYEEMERLGELSGEAQFERALVSEKAGNYTDALQHVTAYMKRFGRGSRHYSDATQLYVRCEPSAKEEEKKRRAVNAFREKQAKAVKRYPWENSLGMRFVGVPGTDVLFSIWETRVRDYQTFVYAKKRDWQKASFVQGRTHPASNIQWADAKAFCEWLTEQERQMRLISKDQFYRLPTDAEWSVAVGLGYEEGSTPDEKNRKIKDVYPWGNEWPPPKGSGNFADACFKRENQWRNAIDGYDDGFPYTSPVASFKSNQYGIYDLGGNVWEWCEDRSEGKQGYPVPRGGSFQMELDEILLSSNRRLTLGTRDDSMGFRCVLVLGDSSEAR